MIALLAALSFADEPDPVEVPVTRRPDTAELGWVQLPGVTAAGMALPSPPVAGWSPELLDRQGRPLPEFDAGRPVRTERVRLAVGVALVTAALVAVTVPMWGSVSTQP